MFNFITLLLGLEKIPPEPIINILKMESIISEQIAKIICQGFIFVLSKGNTKQLLSLFSFGV